jgi:hypothetical protein
MTHHHHHFMTFATPNGPYMKDAHDLCDSATAVARFDTALIENMSILDPEFKNQNEHILREARGGGYWLWKPYVILKRLTELPDGDVLCYCDSSYRFLSDARIIADAWLSDGDIGACHNKPNDSAWQEHTDRKYTKHDTFELMQVPPGDERERIKSTIQAWAGFVLLRKSATSVAFVREWLNYAQNAQIITDSPSTTAPEDPEFKENRHDQSIYSILLKMKHIRLNFIEKQFLHNNRMP